MRISPVDPTDTDWEENSPAYRVYFWTSQESGNAPLCEEWGIAAAPDVAAVIAWADANRRGRTYELFVEHMESRQAPGGWVPAPGLIRLTGVNPVADPDPTVLTFRRGEPA